MLAIRLAWRSRAWPTAVAIGFGWTSVRLIAESQDGFAGFHGSEAAATTIRALLDVVPLIGAMPVIVVVSQLRDVYLERDLYLSHARSGRTLVRFVVTHLLFVWATLLLAILAGTVAGSTVMSREGAMPDGLEYWPVHDLAPIPAAYGLMAVSVMWAAIGASIALSLRSASAGLVGLVGLLALLNALQRAAGAYAYLQHLHASTPLGAGRSLVFGTALAGVHETWSSRPAGLLWCAVWGTAAMGAAVYLGAGPLVRVHRQRRLESHGDVDPKRLGVSSAAVAAVIASFAGYALVPVVARGVPWQFHAAWIRSIHQQRTPADAAAALLDGVRSGDRAVAQHYVASPAALDQAWPALRRVAAGSPRNDTAADNPGTVLISPSETRNAIGRQYSMCFKWTRGGWRLAWVSDRGLRCEDAPSNG